MRSILPRLVRPPSLDKMRIDAVFGQYFLTAAPPRPCHLSAARGARKSALRNGKLFDRALRVRISASDSEPLDKPDMELHRTLARDLCCVSLPVMRRPCDARAATPRRATAPADVPRDDARPVRRRRRRLGGRLHCNSSGRRIVVGEAHEARCLARRDQARAHFLSLRRS